MPLICTNGRTIRDKPSAKTLSISLIIKENTYLAKVVDPSNTAEYDACLRLRHDYFVKKRHWVTSPHPDKEFDHYDPYCTHLAVFDTSPNADNSSNKNADGNALELLAYMRLLLWTPETNGFMLENEFACLLPNQDNQNIIRENSCELSRLVIAPQALKCYKRDESDNSHTQKSNRYFRSHSPMEPAATTANAIETVAPMISSPHVLEVLLKLLYCVSGAFGITQFYAVTEPALLRVLRCHFGIPFNVIGKDWGSPRKTEAVAVRASLADIEDSIKSRWQLRYLWYCRD